MADIRQVQRGSALATVRVETAPGDQLQVDFGPKRVLIAGLRVRIFLLVAVLPFEPRSAHLFFQLVARRYERGSLLITTYQPVTQWSTVFGDDILAPPFSTGGCITVTADDPERKLSTETEEEGGLAREDTIPLVTTVGTRDIVRLAYSTAALAVVKNTDEEKSGLVSNGGQCLLWLEQYLPGRRIRSILS